MKNSNLKKLIVSLGGILAAILSSTCCLVPFILFTFGISGSWISYFTAFAPYKPYFIFLTFLFLGLGFFMFYRQSIDNCTSESYCNNTKLGMTAMLVLVGATILIFIVLIFPYLIKFFF